MERQKIVVVGRAGKILDQLEDIFVQFPVDVQVVEDPQNALALIASFPLELVLVEHPLKQGTVAEFVAEAAENASGEPKIVVLVDEQELAGLLDAIGDRVPIIECGEPTSFQPRVVAHLRQWPARPKRLMVRLQVKLGEQGVDRLAQTENLSESGVLIRTNGQLPVGSEVDLELSLPEGNSPVRVSGKVVRHAEPGSDGIQRLGIVFDRLTTAAAERLNEYLELGMALPAS